MERIFEWDLCGCLVWQGLTPSVGSPLKIPEFSILGHTCYLQLSVTRGDNRNYFLRIISNNGYDSFENTFKAPSFGFGACNYTSSQNTFKAPSFGFGTSNYTSFQTPNVTVSVKKRNGGLVLSKTQDGRWWGSDNLWQETERTIREKIPGFETNGLLRFFIFFDGCDCQNTLNLNLGKVKSVQKEVFVQKDEKSVQTPSYINSFLCMESISRDFSKLLDEGSQHDVKLKCGDHTISAHKIILCTRSQVFAKMLQSDMAEGRTGLVEFQDMEYDVFEPFIKYFYTGTLPELTADTAMRFYEAGDKYAVDGLVKRCSDYLAENLTPENACEVLVLADAHSDREFKEVVVAYIIEKEIPLLDDQWQSFCGGHSVLAVEVLNRFVRSKIDI